MTAVPRVFFGERQILLLMLTASLGAHVAAFFVVGVSDKVKTLGLVERPRVQWMRPQSLERPGKLELQYVVAETLDPSLMSLPNARGFSKKMWERGVAAAHRGVEWGSEPAYLDAKPEKSFPSLLNIVPLPQFVQSATERMSARIEETEQELYEPTVAVNQSVFRIGGTLEMRPVLRAPSLPTIPSNTPLRPTRMRIAVAADGIVRYATLERTSGNEDVDGRALELVRQIRFAPQDTAASDSLAWGVARILWATEPASAPTGGGNGAQP